jgi:hypothetical protein
VHTGDRFPRRSVSGIAECNYIKGKEDAIINLQRASARYYQRPDAEHISVDSSLTSLSGFGGTVKVGRTSQKKLQFETSLTLRSPGLEFNDIGYMRYSDLIHHGTWVAYYIRNPFAIFNNFYLNTNYWMYWDFSGKLLSVSTNMNFNTQFKNRWRLNGSFTRTGENISTSKLRGGPSFVNPGEFGSNLNLNSDQSKKFTFNAGTYMGTGDESFRYQEYWGVEYWREFLLDFGFSIFIQIQAAVVVSRTMIQVSADSWIKRLSLTWD